MLAQFYNYSIEVNYFLLFYGIYFYYNYFTIAVYSSLWNKQREESVRNIW